MIKLIELFSEVKVIPADDYLFVTYRDTGYYVDDNAVEEVIIQYKNQRKEIDNSRLPIYYDIFEDKLSFLSDNEGLYDLLAPLEKTYGFTLEEGITFFSCDFYKISKNPRIKFIAEFLD